MCFNYHFLPTIVTGLDMKLIDIDDLIALFIIYIAPGWDIYSKLIT